VKRGDIYWADLGHPAGRRPVLILTRTSALDVRSRVTIAPITSKVRGIGSEVTLGPGDGVARPCTASCDELVTVPKSWLARRISSLSTAKLAEVDSALRFALGIVS
jgi:mRNA interferase MazF